MASQQMPPMAVKVDFNQGQLDPSNLKGRSVLVTGAASGIGRACAATIAGTGALVTLADRNDAEGEAIVQDMISRGYRVQFVRCDVTSYTEQVAMFQKAVQFGGGKLDIVIPNAGILGGSNLFDLLSADAPTLDGPPPPEPSFVGCEVNLHSVYNSCFLAAHYFRVARETQDTFKPSIVLISSLAGYVGYLSDSNYSSKQSQYVNARDQC
jgi:5'-hydroxyaverantin dehydrogenase